LPEGGLHASNGAAAEVESADDFVDEPLRIAERFLQEQLGGLP
jgi:hypothetical protein